MSGKTAEETARGIAAAVHNSMQAVTIANAELKEFAERKRLKEGFVAPVVQMLEGAGFTCNRTKFGMIVSKPPEDTIPFHAALEISREAQAEGWRSGSSVGSNDPMYE
ncbi:hypothetical protein [Sphingomonas hankookensis]